jgi:hypothetical protein
MYIQARSIARWLAIRQPNTIEDDQALEIVIALRPLLQQAIDLENSRRVLIRKFKTADALANRKRKSECIQEV